MYPGDPGLTENRSRGVAHVVHERVARDLAGHEVDAPYAASVELTGLVDGLLHGQAAALVGRRTTEAAVHAVVRARVAQVQGREDPDLVPGSIVQARAHQAPERVAQLFDRCGEQPPDLLPILAPSLDDAVVQPPGRLELGANPPVA